MKYTSPHKQTKEFRNMEDTRSMLLKLRDEIYEKVKGTPIEGPDDILLRINSCLYLSKRGD